MKTIMAIGGAVLGTAAATMLINSHPTSRAILQGGFPALLNFFKGAAK